jgi:hypothetical protein
MFKYICLNKHEPSLTFPKTIVFCHFNSLNLGTLGLFFYSLIFNFNSICFLILSEYNWLIRNYCKRKESVSYSNDITLISSVKSFSLKKNSEDGRLLKYPLVSFITFLEMVMVIVQN